MIFSTLSMTCLASMALFLKKSLLTVLFIVALTPPLKTGPLKS